MSLHGFTDPKIQFQHYFSNLGRRLLEWAGYSERIHMLLEKLYHNNQAVHMASAALGAAIESVDNLEKDALDRLFRWQYDRALVCLRNEISRQAQGPIPVFIASTILAGVEALRRNLSDALKHSQGALNVFISHIHNSSPPETRPGKSANHMFELKAVKVLAQEVDLQNATYRLSDRPGLSNVAPSHQNYTSETEIDHRLREKSAIVADLHAAYCFGHGASKHKYRCGSSQPHEFVLEQGFHLEQLSRCLVILNDMQSMSSVAILDPSLVKSSGALRPESILHLRLACLSAIIHLSTVLSPYEVTFDSLDELFRQIVVNAEVLLSEPADSSKTKAGFRILSSLSQPLFLVAMKCRRPMLRRQAVDLLSRTTKEGPWDPSILVPIARRAILLEEQLLLEKQSESALGDEPLFSSAGYETVPERARLHGCGMGFITSDTGAPVNGVVPGPVYADGKLLPRTIVFRFRRCVNIERLLGAHEVERPVADDNVLHWEVWDEKIEL